MHTDSNNEKTISVLNDLIETCRDGETGFKNAAEHAEQPALKQLFNSLATQRGSFVSELEVHVSGLGGKPAEQGHIAAVAHRGWMDLKSAVVPSNDKAILEECERGEDFAKKAYTDALKEPLLADVMPIVTKQAAEVRAAHDKVRDLRNAARAD